MVSTRLPGAVGVASGASGPIPHSTPNDLGVQPHPPPALPHPCFPSPQPGPARRKEPARQAAACDFPSDPQVPVNKSAAAAPPPPPRGVRPKVTPGFGRRPPGSPRPSFWALPGFSSPPGREPSCGSELLRVAPLAPSWVPP